jgi:hypothetical protein
VTGLPSECWDCHRRVVWAVTAANSKRMMLNPDPDPAGNQAAYRDHTETFRTRQLGDGEEPQGYERRYMPHVATCTGKRREQQPAQPPEVPPPPRELPTNVIEFAAWRRQQRKDRP